MSLANDSAIRALYRTVAERAVRLMASGDQPAALRLLSDPTPQAVLEYLRALLASGTPDEASAATQLLLHCTVPGAPSLAGIDAEALPVARRFRTEYWAYEISTFLKWAASAQPQSQPVSIEQIPGESVGTLVGMAALSRAERPDSIRMRLESTKSKSRFAHAIGFTSVVDNVPLPPTHEVDRSVRMIRVRSLDGIYKAANQISTLVLPKKPDSSSRKLLEYAMVELLRNTIQHSADPLGAVVAAQLNQEHFGPHETEGVQIAVADSGMGVLAALEYYHPDVRGNSKAAIAKALRPHVSGTFKEGVLSSEGGENAGLGLFFIAEMAKLSGGRLAIASRGAAMVVEGSEGGADDHETWWMREDSHYPGTLVVFEFPRVLAKPFDAFDDIMEEVRGRARQRRPQRHSNHWIHFAEPEMNTESFRLVMQVAAPTVSQLRALVHQQLIPRIEKGHSICLDLLNRDVVTQSEAHTMIYHVVRAAYARQIPLYVTNATSAVAGMLNFVQEYALADQPSRR